MYIPSEYQINVISCQSNIEILEVCVCDVTRKEYMLNKCEDCPGFENVIDFLRNEICRKWSADDTIF